MSTLPITRSALLRAAKLYYRRATLNRGQPRWSQLNKNQRLDILNTVELVLQSYNEVEKDDDKRRSRPNAEVS